MASAWGNSWGVAWGNSWGSIDTAVTTAGGGIAHRRRKKKPKKRDIEDALTLAEAVLSAEASVDAKKEAKAIASLSSPPGTDKASVDFVMLSERRIDAILWRLDRLKEIMDEEDEDVTILILMQ